MNDEAYQKYCESCANSPMIKTLLKHFMQISAGESQVPQKTIEASVEFLAQDAELSKYHRLFCKNMGPLFEHFVASVPFILEEFCRTAIACIRLAQSLAKTENDYFTFYGLGSLDGAQERTIAQYSNGLIRTFTDSPNSENTQIFYRSCNPEYSKFYHGIFCYVTPEFFASQPELSIYQGGFDFIFEPIVFAFYGPNRREQIKYSSRLLKEDGLFMCLEKLKNKNILEYQKFEKIKDEEFKSLYFSEQDLSLKKEVFLKNMSNSGQVDFNIMSDALKYHFKHVYLIWNSANFYEFVASNSEKNISRFVSLMPDPYVPSQFRLETNMVRKLS